MPELPEVETIRRDLDRELAGQTVGTVVASGIRSIRRHGDADVMRARLVGRRVTSVGRRGKYLLLRCRGSSEGAEIADAGDEPVLVVHLGMSGQLLLASAGDSAIAHTHVVVGLEPDRELRFVDPRTFGEVFVSSVAVGGDAPPELAHLGLDPLDGVKNAPHLGRLLQARRSQLKALLMDQRFLAGIGNMYADEILFAAGLRYDRASDSLSHREVERLHRAMTETLEAAIRHRGSSLADQQYRDAFGAVGDFQRHHQVYAREGRPCPRCQRLLIRVRSGGRSNFLCPRCQG